MHTLFNIWRIAPVGLLPGLVVMAGDVQAGFIKSKCFDGAAWYGSIHPGESSGVTIVPCGEEEPASLFSLSCRPGEQRLSISLDYPSSGGGENRLYDIELRIDDNLYLYRGKLNQAGMYETMEFDISSSHRMVENLMSGAAGSYRVGKVSGKFHLKGTRQLITAMLKACGL